MLEAPQRHPRSGVISSLSCLLLLVTLTLSPAVAAPASAAGAQAERVAVGDEAIDFTMQTIDGETLRLSELRGNKNVIIIFFRGTW